MSSLSLCSQQYVMFCDQVYTRMNAGLPWYTTGHDPNIPGGYQVDCFMQSLLDDYTKQYPKEVDTLLYQLAFPFDTSMIPPLDINQFKDTNIIYDTSMIPAAYTTPLTPPPDTMQQDTQMMIPKIDTTTTPMAYTPPAASYTPPSTNIPEEAAPKKYNNTCVRCTLQKRACEKVAGLSKCLNCLSRGKACEPQERGKVGRPPKKVAK